MIFKPTQVALCVLNLTTRLVWLNFIHTNMTRKDYKLIAGVLNDINNNGDIRIIVNDFCKTLKEDNNNFNKYKFVSACFDVPTTVAN